MFEKNVWFETSSFIEKPRLLLTGLEVPILILAIFI